MPLARAVPLLLIITSLVLPPAARAGACEDLAGTSIPAAAIGAPTSGASVTSATSVAATAATGEYCRVLFSIHPVDPTAPNVNAQLNLPSAWNGKALMFGGGGYDGTMPATTGNYFNGPVGVPVPLAQGYATFGSDSGHQANGLGAQDGSFGLNEEALVNFTGFHLEKTRDASIHLLRGYYGGLPLRTYFVGGSTGGREALWVALNAPEDFDGVVSMYPAWNAATLDLQFGRITRALAKEGAYPNTAKQLVWVRANIAACDALDGLADGIVSNTAACEFDPMTATVADGSAPLRCPGGVDAGNSCLSDAQIEAITVYATPLQLTVPTGSGETSYPGFPVFLGGDLTGSLDLNRQQPTSEIMTSDQASAAACFGDACLYKGMPYFSIFWDQWVKYFITGDPTFDSLALDPQDPGVWAEVIQDRTTLQDVNSTDLSAFRRRGGKLILMHGLADGLVATDATIEYHERLVRDMGQDVRSFVRFYTIPGLGHVRGSPAAAGGGFSAAWDPVAALDAWVETGDAPGTLIATDANAATFGRTRPVCEYPRFPRYQGGDPNLASSFRCARD